MNKEYFDKWAREYSHDLGFIDLENLSYGTYYDKRNIRSAVYSVLYDRKTMILKLFDDPRITYEVEAQTAFSKINKSEILKAPEIFKAEQITSNKGWLLMEKLPDDCKQLSQPLPQERRYKFLDLYSEYKKNAPKKSFRLLTLAEQLPAHEFHSLRIARWLQLANDKQEKEDLHFLGKSFIRLYEQAMEILRNEFRGRKMIWSAHDLFKPEDIFEKEKDGKKEYYLIDFCQAGMHPEGYELSTIVWADWIISADWRMSFKNWAEGIQEWLDIIWNWNLKQSISKRKSAKNFHRLLNACLIERILGTILADVCASDRPKEEKQARISYLIKYLKSLIKDYR